MLCHEQNYKVFKIKIFPDRLNSFWSTAVLKFPESGTKISMYSKQTQSNATDAILMAV